MLVKSITGKLNLVHIILSTHVYFSVHVHVLKEDKVYQHIVLESNVDRYVLIQGSGTVIVNESLIQCSRTR